MHYKIYFFSYSFPLIHLLDHGHVCLNKEIKTVNTKESVVKWYIQKISQLSNVDIIWKGSLPKKGKESWTP